MEEETKEQAETNEESVLVDEEDEILETEED